MSESLLNAVTAFIATWGLKVVGVLITLVVAWIVAGWADHTLSKTLKAKKFDPMLSNFFAKLLRYAILVGAVLGVLGVFGIETTSFAAVIGAAGLAVGLAFQGTLSNFASGVMLLIFRPFKVGDVIKVAGHVGAVSAVDLFSTELTTPDNRKIIIPNSSVFGATIENITHHPTRRVDIPVGVAYDADLDATRKLLEHAAATTPGVLADPAPQIFLESLGDSSVNWQVRLWCDTANYWDVHQAAIVNVKKTLDEARVGIPFPQLELHLGDQTLAAFQGKGSN